MKIKNFKKLSNNNEFIKLKILKSHSKQTNLIKICNIIYQYNLKNKKILFIGFPSNYKSIFKKIKHKMIPDYLLFNGILTNIIKPKIKNVSLIVIHNQNDNLTIKKESDKKRIPIIALNDKQNLTKDIAYRGLNNYKSFKERKTANNLFLTFLKTTFLKTK